MMAYTDLSGLAGVAFALGVALSRLPLISRVAVARGWLVAGIMLASLVPVGELSLAGYGRGLLGDLSVTSLLLLGAAVCGKKVWLQWRPVLLTTALAAVALYPCALGVGSFDPYRLGYGNHYFLMGLLLFALLGWARRHTLLALAISLAVLAWSLGAYASANLWDYLLDPWLALYAIVKLVLGRRQHAH